LYLAWAVQAFFVQRGFQYAHIPETLLMIGIWASHRWAWTPIVLLWLAVTSGLWIAADFSPNLEERLKSIDLPTKYVNQHAALLPRHPITCGSRLRAWQDCWRLDMPDSERYALWGKLQLHPMHEAVIGWEELAEVAEFLRHVPREDGGVGVRDGEVLAWFDSPHAIYLLLDIKPGIRFMHVYTAEAITTEDPEVGSQRVLRERLLAEKHAKFVISDLEWTVLGPEGEKNREAWLAPAEEPPNRLLPAAMPHRGFFPFNQSTIFRTRNNTGRYIVHRIIPEEHRAFLIGLMITIQTHIVRQVGCPKDCKTP
jgi:hypothetical protein